MQEKPRTPERSKNSDARRTTVCIHALRLILTFYSQIGLTGIQSADRDEFGSFEDGVKEAFDVHGVLAWI